MAHNQPQQSIKNKLTLLVMIISVALLVLVSVVVLAAEVLATRTALIQEIRMLSAALGTNTREPLVLGQYQETEKLLQALNSQQNIHAAYLFNDRGKPVAEYLSQKNSAFVWRYLQEDFAPANTAFWTTATQEQINSCFYHLAIFTPIFFDGQRIGALYVLSDLEALYGRLSGVAFGIGLSVILLAVISWILAGRLQKPISDPLLNLAHVMAQVSKERDYSVRAEKMTNDEIALLVEGLNHMLDQVEEHQQQQARYQDHLEVTVTQRTQELRTAVIELEKARHRTDAANEAKSQFLSRMTHELRTPLIGVLGMNGLLQRTALTEQQRALVETVDKSGNDLLALISDVLDIARIEAGVLELDNDQIEPARIIEEVVELLAPQAHAKGVELLTDIPVTALRAARGDRARIWQIMMNLIGNAIKFTAAGTVTVHLDLLPAEVGRGRFIMKVEDTGVGMDVATAERVFDLFYQHSDLSIAVSPGSGLGLPIVKQLVDLMGGQITVVSKLGEGSCFSVELELPLVDPERAGVAQLTGRRVVVACPQQPSTALLVAKLTALGAEVVAVETDHIPAKSVAPFAPCDLLVVCQDRYEQMALGGDLLRVSTLSRQLVVVSRNSSVDEEIVPGALLIHEPVTWKRLHDLIERWQHQGELSLQNQDPALPVRFSRATEQGRVVLVGRHAALRQLLRLLLRNWQLELDCVDHLDDGVALCQGDDMVVMMIVSAADVDAAELLTLRGGEAGLPPCYLLGDGEPDSEEVALVAGWLQQPINPAALQEVIMPLLQRFEQRRCAVSGGI